MQNSPSQSPSGSFGYRSAFPSREAVAGQIDSLLPDVELETKETLTALVLGLLDEGRIFESKTHALLRQRFGRSSEALSGLQLATFSLSLPEVQAEQTPSSSPSASLSPPQLRLQELDSELEAGATQATEMNAPAHASAPRGTVGPDAYPDANPSYGWPSERKHDTILRLSIECVGGAYLKDHFLRVVEVSSDMTLGRLHDYMQELIGFDSDHMFTFYVANTRRGKQVWFTASGEWEDLEFGMEDEAQWIIALHQIFPLPKHKKLYYWFDFGDDWIFEIRKKGKEGLPASGATYPRVIFEEGPKPTQYPVYNED